MGFSRQEHWSGLAGSPPGDRPHPGIKHMFLMSPALAGGFFSTSATPGKLKTLLKSESEVAQLCLTLCDPMDCTLPGSSLHGILQARVSEWVAISTPKFETNT